MIFHTQAESDAYHAGYKAGVAARPEAMAQEEAWNGAIAAVVKLLRSNADGCSPGSAAEVQNWPFVLETMAREVERMRRQSEPPMNLDPERKP